MNESPIGIFDSGVGGLTIFKEIKKALPYENIIYFGDTGRFPYGDKPKDVLLNYSKQIINFLKQKKVKVIVIACNTISGYCYSELKEMFNDIPIIEIIKSGAKYAASSTKNNIIGLLATEATVKSLKYEQEIHNINKNIKIFSVSCPKFAPLAEDGQLNSSLAYLTAKEYIQPLINKKIDTLVLGCTHYPILLNSIKNNLPRNINIVNPAIEVSHNLKIFLEDNNLLSQKKEDVKDYFYISGDIEKFNSMCKIVLNQTYLVEKIKINGY